MVDYRELEPESAGVVSEDRDVVLRLDHSIRSWKRFGLEEGPVGEELGETIDLIPFIGHYVRNLWLSDLGGSKGAISCTSWDGESAFGLGKVPEHVEDPATWVHEAKKRKCEGCPSKEFTGPDGARIPPVCRSQYRMLVYYGKPGAPLDSFLWGWWETTGSYMQMVVRLWHESMKAREKQDGVDRHGNRYTVKGLLASQMQGAYESGRTVKRRAKKGKMWVADLNKFVALTPEELEYINQIALEVPDLYRTAMSNAESRSKGRFERALVEREPQSAPPRENFKPPF